MPECPVCRATTHRETGRYQKYVLLHCLSCDLRFSDPMRAEGSFYSTNPDYVMRDFLIVDTLRWDYHGDKEYFLKHPPVAKGRLLDVGCGTGAFVKRALEQGFDAFGIDFDREAIDRGRAHFGTDRLITGDVMTVREILGMSGFDVITLFQILEHVEDPLSMVTALRGNLRDGGVLVIAFPCMQRWPVLGEEWGDLPPHHFTRWSARALRGLLGRAGFAVRKEFVEPFSYRNMAGLIYPFVLKAFPRLTMKGRRVHETVGALTEQEKQAMLLARKRKVDMVNRLGIPLWIVLRLLGARGPNLYVEAEKT